MVISAAALQQTSQETIQHNNYALMFAYKRDIFGAEIFLQNSKWSFNKKKLPSHEDMNHLTLPNLISMSRFKVSKSNTWLRNKFK